MHSFLIYTKNEFTVKILIGNIKKIIKIRLLVSFRFYCESLELELELSVDITSTSSCAAFFCVLNENKTKI